MTVSSAERTPSHYLRVGAASGNSRFQLRQAGSSAPQHTNGVFLSSYTFRQITCYVFIPPIFYHKLRFFLKKRDKNIRTWDEGQWSGFNGEPVTEICLANLRPRNRLQATRHLEAGFRCWTERREPSHVCSMAVQVSESDQIKQFKEFLGTYNKLTENCFMDCVKDFTSREVKPEELF
ncbi:mitochondrial import inner membrane translocase subunit Tim9 isoform X2 [Lampris incognitus]|uniref:mitochondrial import inner membrane translocase subunit Tim9 isoform X2 n=1 Tax=Lampris incognitus TaxID=2546036 RepID=UPI0024B4805A|nr:mitochondrial import inner membrane translocase subunit Tim9 isoform X2 [Lampris incognitus]